MTGLDNSSALCSAPYFIYLYDSDNGLTVRLLHIYSTARTIILYYGKRKYRGRTSERGLFRYRASAGVQCVACARLSEFTLEAYRLRHDIEQALDANDDERDGKITANGDFSRCVFSWRSALKQILLASSQERFKCPRRLMWFLCLFSSVKYTRCACRFDKSGRFVSKIL